MSLGQNKILLQGKCIFFQIWIWGSWERCYWSAIHVFVSSVFGNSNSFSQADSCSVFWLSHSKIFRYFRQGFIQKFEIWSDSTIFHLWDSMRAYQSAENYQYLDSKEGKAFSEKIVAGNKDLDLSLWARFQKAEYQRVWRSQILISLFPTIISFDHSNNPLQGFWFATKKHNCPIPAFVLINHRNKRA